MTARGQSVPLTVWVMAGGEGVFFSLIVKYASQPSLLPREVMVSKRKVHPSITFLLFVYPEPHHQHAHPVGIRGNTRPAWLEPYVTLPPCHPATLPYHRNTARESVMLFTNSLPRVGPSLCCRRRTGKTGQAPISLFVCSSRKHPAPICVSKGPITSSPHDGAASVGNNLPNQSLSK